MVVNMNMHSDDPGSINKYLSDTVSSVFDEVATIIVPDNTNRELFAGEKAYRQTLPPRSSQSVISSCAA